MRIKCPGCSSEVPAESIDIDAGLARCQCGVEIGLSDLIETPSQAEQRVPLGSKITVKESGADELYILIPPVGANLRVILMIVAVILGIGFAIGWVSFFWRFERLFGAFGLFGLLLLLFILGIVSNILFALFGKTGVHINSTDLVIIKDLFGIKRQKAVPLEKVGGIEVVQLRSDSDSPRIGPYLSIKHGWRSRKIAHGLSEKELNWLAREIRRFVNKLTG